METFTNSSDLFFSGQPVPIHISDSSFTDSNKSHSSAKHVSSENIIEDTSSSNNSYQFLRSKKKLLPATLRKKNKVIEREQHSSENIDQIISFEETPSKSKIPQDLFDSKNLSPDLLKMMPPRDCSPGGERSLRLLNNIMERMSAKKSCKTPYRTPLTIRSDNGTGSEIITPSKTPMRTKLPRISGIASLKTAISSPLLSSNTKPEDSMSHNILVERSFSTPSISRSYASTTSERSELPISNELSNECLDTPKIMKSDHEDEDDDSLPPTQLCSQSGILNGVIAYVEVRFGADNRSWGVKGTLEDLGAAVVPKFNKNVTHVIFHEGLLSTYKKAKRWKVHIVSVLWIEECKNTRKIVSERLYPPLDIYKYEHAELFKSIPRVKSIQPDFENEQPLKLTRKKLKLFNEMKERLRKEREELEKVRNQIETENKTTVSPNQRRLETFKLLLNPEDHHLLTDGKIVETKTVNNSQNSDDIVTTPLAVRLWRKLNTPKENHSSIDIETQAIDKNINIIHETDNDSSKTSGSSIISATRHAVRSNLFPTISKLTENCSNNKENESSEPYLTNSDLNKVQDIDFSNLSNPSNIQDKTRFDETDLSITNCSKGETTYLSEAFSSDSKPITGVKKRKLFTQPRALSFEDLGSPPSSPASLKIPTMESLIINTQKLEIGPPSKRVCRPKTTNTKIKNKNNPSENKKSVKASTKKPIKRDLFNSTKSTDTRTSSQLFIPQKQSFTPRSTRSSSYLFQSDDFRYLRSTSRNSIVFTSLHREESIMVAELVNCLGGFTVDETVSSRTSHLICGRPRRTINLLKAIARGCWIVSLDWIHACKQQNRWVEEIDYELHEFSPAVQQCRLDRLSFGPTFRLQLFQFCGNIFVSPKSDPKRQDISDLITLASGIVTKTSRNADIIIGNYPDSKHGSKKVSEKWVLDSIMNNELHDINEYLM